MAGSFYDDRDSVDISELAALNDDISDDLISKLQQQITENLPQENPGDNIEKNNDAALFEESNADVNNSDINPSPEAETNLPEGIQQESPVVSDNSTTEDTQKKDKVEVNKSFDDNFIKKYKAKLLKKQKGIPENAVPVSYGGVAPATGNENSDAPQNAAADNTPIESLSQGNITERPLTNELKNYNDSLDFLDGNIKYSKYVIYIDPENVDFIEGLTVKERKNLINGILRQQNDITITKQRFRFIQAIVRHAIILILTIAISIPVVYHVINASLEATINNHRYAQTNWQALYRENGKITRN